MAHNAATIADLRRATARAATQAPDVVRVGGVVPVRDVAPAGLRRWMWTAVATAVAVALGDALLAGHYRLDIATSGSHLPFPGRAVAVALALAAGAVALTTELVLNRIATRGTVSGVTTDLERRRSAARAVLRGSQWLIGMATAAILTLGGAALFEVGRATSAQALSQGGNLADVVGWILALTCSFIAVWRGGPMYEDAPCGPTPALAPAAR